MKNEVPPCRLKSRKPYNMEAQERLCGIPGDRSERCMDCGNVEAGVGSIRTHSSTPPRIKPRRRCQGRRSEPKTLDESKQTANRGRSVGLQSIHEEEDDWRTVQHVSVAIQNRQLTTSSIAAHYIDYHPKLASSMLGH